MSSCQVRAQDDDDRSQEIRKGDEGTRGSKLEAGKLVRCFNGLDELRILAHRSGLLR